MNTYQLAQLSIEQLHDLDIEIKRLIRKRTMDNVTKLIGEKYAIGEKIAITDFTYHEVGYEATEMVITFILDVNECVVFKRNIYDNECNFVLRINDCYIIVSDENKVEIKSPVEGEDIRGYFENFCSIYKTNKKELLEISAFMIEKFD